MTTLGVAWQHTQTRNCSGAGCPKKAVVYSFYCFDHQDLQPYQAPETPKKAEPLKVARSSDSLPVSNWLILSKAEASALVEAATLGAPYVSTRSEPLNRALRVVGLQLEYLDGGGGDATGMKPNKESAAKRDREHPA